MESCHRGRGYHHGEHIVRGTQGCDLVMVNLALRLLISGSEEMVVELGLGYWHAHRSQLSVATNGRDGIE